MIDISVKNLTKFFVIGENLLENLSFEIQEGIYNGVYVIKGEEISPKNENHYDLLGCWSIEGNIHDNPELLKGGEG